MWILVRVDSSLLERFLKYLKNLKIWHRIFPEKVYQIEVTAEDRSARMHSSNQLSHLNPPRAWETCRSFVQAWDWDDMGRGPSALSDYALEKPGANKAPHGKGWIINRWGKRQRVAGECAHPENLGSCAIWCPFYEPTTIEGLIYMAEQTASEHEQRAAELRRHVEFLKTCETSYEEAIRTGGVWRYENGRFVVTEP